MKQFPDDWSMLEKINYLQKMILVNSALYYKYNTTALSDFAYDEISKQLVKYMEEYPISKRISTYAYVFDDYDGTTGFHLVDNLEPADYYNVILSVEIYLENRRRKQ